MNTSKNKVFSISKYIFLLLCVGVTSIFAQSIVITDRIGNSKTIENPKIYYSSKNPSSMQMFYTPDVDSNGLRVKMGLGTLLLEWNKISSIDFLEIENQIINVTSKTGKKEIFTYIIPSSDGLQGNMELGEFSIDFKNIKSIQIVNKEKQKKGK